MKELTAHTITACLREIEDIALELDKAIDSSHIDHRKLTELKKRYQKNVDVLNQSIQANDSRFYSIDEAAGLFSWIDGDKHLATEQVAAAVVKKGDTQLTSHAARGLAATIKTKTSPSAGKNGKRVLYGWLSFFHATVLLIAIVSVLITILGTFGMFVSPPVDFAAWIIMLVFWAISILSVSYLVCAARGSQHARPLAISLFLLLSAFCGALLISVLVAESYDPDIKMFTLLTLLFLIACGVSTALYYARSSRVRQAFDS